MENDMRNRFVKLAAVVALMAPAWAKAQTAPATRPSMHKVVVHQTGGGAPGVANVPLPAWVFQQAQKTERGTFLGLRTSNASAALREQLELAKGFGLVVETVEKDSPAEKASVQQYDVLQKLDDQLLVN